ncbi:serine acetyltransferase [Polynucleobacter paneuropaeus]|nr:serine acetyltransferase [Polynucleobacter paneuropaeus]
MFKYIAADLQRSLHLQYGADANLSAPRKILGLLNFRFWPILIFRTSQFFYSKNFKFIAKIFTTINFIVFGVEISPKCSIGRGLYLPHTQGTVIGAYSIGENATIFQGVTLGSKQLDFDYLAINRPQVGDDVVLGAGAKILGGIKVGSGVVVAANSLVLESLPDHAIALGVPAKVIKYKA